MTEFQIQLKIEFLLPGASSKKMLGIMPDMFLSWTNHNKWLVNI